MNDNLTPESNVEVAANDTVEPVASEQMPNEADAAQVQPDGEAPGDTDTVRTLRDELAKRRIKAREQVSAANERLALAYVQADGRLVDSDAFTITDDLLGDDGFIDGAKVTEAIDALLAAKPYLSARKPSTPIAQGVQPLAPETPGLFTLIRERY